MNKHSHIVTVRDEDPDPIGSVDFWPTGKKMMVYNIEFYPYLPKISIYFLLHFDFRSDPAQLGKYSGSDSGLKSKLRKKYGILIPGNNSIFIGDLGLPEVWALA